MHKWMFWKKHYHSNQTIGTTESEEKNNPEHKCYDYVDSIRLVQTFSKIYVLCRIRRCVIIECPQIENEVRDEFVKHVG
jgi:hypothetical protein